MKLSLFGKALLLAGVLSFGGVRADRVNNARANIVYLNNKTLIRNEVVKVLVDIDHQDEENKRTALEDLEAYRALCTKNVADNVNCDELFASAMQALQFLEERRKAELHDNFADKKNNQLEEEPVEPASEASAKKKLVYF